MLHWFRSCGLEMLTQFGEAADDQQFLRGGPGLTSSCSRIQVSPCGTKTACSPAASAGLMSDFGLLPTIQVELA